MKNIVIILFFLFSCFSFAYSEDSTKIINDDHNWLNHRVGIYGSTFSGYGLSYQYQFDNGISIRNQFFAEKASEDRQRINYGIDLQNNITRYDILRFYYIVGAGYSYLMEFSESENNYNIGSGFGLEVMVWRHFSFAIELGFSGQYGNKTEIVYKTVDGKYQPFSLETTVRNFNFGGGFGIFLAI